MKLENIVDKALLTIKSMTLTGMMFIWAQVANAQSKPSVEYDTLKIATYNLLNYPGNDTTGHNPNFRTVIKEINPDILVAQEVISQAGVDGFLNNVMRSFGRPYAAGLFINGPDTDNAIFYDSTKLAFISNTPIKTALRDINGFKMVNKASNDTFIVYSVHLKASSGSSNEILRAAEVDSLRKATNKLPLNTDFMVLGDFNIYRYSESAFQKLLNQSSSGYFIDPLNLTVNWSNDPLYAKYHTQSTRTRQLPDGGSTGGMDDRFDMILISDAVNGVGGMQYVPNSTVNYGNDGFHFNDSINKPPNIAVGQVIANALHYASDHLPVFSKFVFPKPEQYIALNLRVLIEGFYDGTSMRPDTIEVFLRQVFPPYAKADSAKILIDSTGFGTAKFYNASSGTYYIAVKHRNSIETWSRAGGEPFIRGTH